MSLPVRLYPGIVSIYGASSVMGLQTEGMQFGLVDQIWDDIQGTLSIGQSVMFPIEKSITVTYGNMDFFLVEQNDIKLIEIIPV